MLRDLVLHNRSYRRFGQEPVTVDTLRELVGLARLCASGGNKQPLKFFLSADAESNARIFPCLAWAGYLTDWPGPSEGERPTAYIVIVGDTAVAEKPGCDHGIAAQTILLGAVEKGLGGCMIGAFKREELAGALALDARYRPLLVIALGKPAETVVIEDLGASGDIKYWRDESGVHHVPKRSLESLLIGGD